VCDLGALTDVLEGLGKLMEEQAPANAGTEARAMIRLAQAALADALDVYRNLDGLWLDLNRQARAAA
jgi:hypothetical protein